MLRLRLRLLLRLLRPEEPLGLGTLTLNSGCLAGTLLQHRRCFAHALGAERQVNPDNSVRRGTCCCRVI
jgi:hypothetical protein